MPEPLIDEVNDTGIYLEDGHYLSFTDLGRILEELSLTALLQVLPGMRDAINVYHTGSTFKEASRIFKVMGEVHKKVN